MDLITKIREYWFGYKLRRDIKKLVKAIEIGGYDASPTKLTQGEQFLVEDPKPKT